MARMTRAGLGFLLIAVLIGTPAWYYFAEAKRQRNFRVVRPGTVFRCGQLDRSGLERLIRQHGIRTVINLREQDGSKADPSRWEEEYCRARGIAYLRILPRTWWAPEGPPPATEGIVEFLSALNDERRFPRPVLIHCYAGIHRTGAYCAIYRMEFDGWTNAEAIEEMERCGYTEMHEDVRGFLRDYQPTWKKRPSSSEARSEGSLPSP